LNNSPPLVPDHTRNKGELFIIFPTPKFSACGAYETGFRDIYDAFRVRSPPQANIFDILRFCNAILLRKSTFSASKSQTFSPPAESLRQAPKSTRNKEGIIHKGGIIQTNTPDLLATFSQEQKTVRISLVKMNYF
jgi:hypothetical protein